MRYQGRERQETAGTMSASVTSFDDQTGEPSAPEPEPSEALAPVFETCSGLSPQAMSGTFTATWACVRKFESTRRLAHIAVGRFTRH